MLDLKITSTADIGTPKTGSTNNSSNGSHYNSDEEEIVYDSSELESPFKAMTKVQTYKKSPAIEVSTLSPTKKNKQLEGSWKRKVKTELCRFWLQGLPCEN